MSMLNTYRRVFRAFYRTCAFAGVVGTTATGTHAAMDTNHQDSGDNLQVTSSASDNLDNLKRLIALQRRQIGLRQVALGVTRQSNDSVQIGLEFILPNDANVLQDMIATQQRWLESQERELAELQSVPASATESDLQIPDPTILRHAVDRPDAALVLPRHIESQEDSSRALFNQALESVKNQAMIAAAAEPALNRDDVVFESGRHVLEAPKVSTPVWRSVDASRVEPAHRPNAADGDLPIQDTAEQLVALVETEPKSAAQTPPVDESLDERGTELAQVDYGTKTVPDEELAEVRAGFVTRKGLIVNVGVVFETMVNGRLVAQNVINLNNPNRSFLDDGGVTTVIEGLDGGTTEITNSISDGVGVSTLITNTSSNIVIEQVNTITVDIPNHTEVFGVTGGGNDFVRGIDLPQSFIDMAVGVIQQ